MVLHYDELVVIAGAQTVCGVYAGGGIGLLAYVVQGMQAGVGDLLQVQPSQGVFLKGGLSHRRGPFVLIIAVIHKAPESHGGIVHIIYQRAVGVIGIVKIRQTQCV